MGDREKGTFPSLSSREPSPFFAVGKRAPSVLCGVPFSCCCCCQRFSLCPPFESLLLLLHIAMHYPQKVGGRRASLPLPFRWLLGTIPDGLLACLKKLSLPSNQSEVSVPCQGHWAAIEEEEEEEEPLTSNGPMGHWEEREENRWKEEGCRQRRKGAFFFPSVSLE